MNIKEISLNSKKRAEEIAKIDGGILVPVYAVVKADKLGRVQSITHDRLDDLIKVNVVDTSICFLCKDEFHTCEGSSYRLKAEEGERREIVCADCAYNPKEKLAKYNQVNAKSGDRIFSFNKKAEYQVNVVDEYGIYLEEEEFRYPMNPMDFKDFVILN